MAPETGEQREHGPRIVEVAVVARSERREVPVFLVVRADADAAAGAPPSEDATLAA
jgi:hypothetical protein